MKSIQLEETTILGMNELLTVIENRLNECKDIQIFIAKKLFQKLLKENEDKLIWKEAVIDSFHYCNSVEKAFLVNIIKDATTQVIQLHFAENCSDFVQLTYFATKGILYRHYLKGMEKILIINAD